jgi:GDP-4-dehydro-6-deoxy-D-mannose reductase
MVEGNKMKTLITGVSGFVGSHLAEFLLGKNEEVFGTIRWRSRMDNIEEIKDEISLHECDMKDAVAIRELIEKIRPDSIYHLAAQSYVKASWSSPAETFMINVIGALNLFEAVRAAKLSPKILLAGSSEEYGFVKNEELPIKETNQLRPLSPYAVSKISQDMLGYQYFKSYGIKIIRTRAFNLTGPRRGDVFADSNFAKQIVMIEKKKKEPKIEVGNLNAYRDFTDVRDVVRAYWLALNKCDPGEVYNISSGQAVCIKDILEKLIKISGVKVEIVQDPQRIRPSDEPIIQGDNSKFREKTGWRPEISLDNSLKDLLNYWRERLK